MQKKEAGVVERGDALYHGAVDAIDDGALEAGGGGFLLLSSYWARQFRQT